MFRHRSAPARFLGPPSPHILPTSDDIVCGREGRAPKSPIQYLPKIESPIADSPILDSVGFRQLPSSSVGFIGLPYPQILPEFRHHGIWGGSWRKPNFAGRYLPKIESASAVFFLAAVSFRQLPEPSVSIHGVPSPPASAYIAQLRQHGMWEREWAEAKVPEAKFT